MLHSGGAGAAEEEVGSDAPKVFVHDNIARTYQLYVPPDNGDDGLRPLVIVLHGGYGGAGSARDFGFDEVAAEENFLVAYPEGLGRHWNDGRDRPSDPPVEGDDVGFISALADELVETHRADPRRTFVTGMSNGAMMASRVGCERADRFLAIAPVAGSMSAGVASSCSPVRPISVMHFHGTADTLAKYEGSDGSDPDSPIASAAAGGATIGVEEAVAFWSQHGQCTSYSESLLADTDPLDGTRVRQHMHEDCAAGASVVLYEIEGGGHAWPGGSGRLAALGRTTGPTSRDIDATRTIWDFFESRCPLPELEGEASCDTRPVATTLEYAGATTARGENVHVAAVLKDANGNPVVGQMVQFTAGGRSLAAETDSLGGASGTLWMPDHGRKEEIHVAFDGAPRLRLLASTTSAVVTWGAGGLD